MIVNFNCKKGKIQLKILICGGTRFYGVQLVKQLSMAQHSVTVISRSIPSEPIEGVHYIQGEIEEEIETSIKKEEYDFAVNNICMCKSDAENYMRYIAKYAKNHILISSIGVYEANQEKRIPEEDDFRPQYEAEGNINEAYHDKREAERVYMKNISKERLFILRPSVLIGKMDWTDRLGFYIQRLLDGGGIITVLDGENYFQWAYDFQLAAVVQDIIENSGNYRFAVYNVADNQYMTFRKFLVQLASVLKVKEFFILSMQKAGLTKTPYEGFRDPYGKADCVCDTSRLENLTGSLLMAKSDILKEIVLERADRLDLKNSPDYEKRVAEIAYIEEHKEKIEKVIVKDWVNVN